MKHEFSPLDMTEDGYVPTENGKAADVEWTENINKSIIHKKICHYIQSYLSDTIRMHGLKDSNAFHSFTHVLVNPFDISKCKSNVPAEALDEWHDATFGFGEANISGEPEYGV